MSDLETAISTKLNATAGVTALVSTRIYPEHLPQSPTYPALTFERVDTERVSAMGADTGNAAVVMQIVCHALTYAGAKALALQVLTALQRFAGTVSTVVIDDMFVIDQSFDFDDDTNVYEISIDFQVWHRE